MAEPLLYTEEFLLTPAKLHHNSYFMELWPGSEPCTVEIPAIEAVLTYNTKTCCPTTLQPGDSGTHIIAQLLTSLEKIADYNKLLVCTHNDTAYVVLATGEKLLLAQSYKTNGEMTLLYWLLLAARQTQTNPQQTVVRYIGDGGIVDTSNIRECFKGVEKL